MQKILIADNCEEFSLVLAGALRANYLVEVCEDGTRALELLRSTRPDVLIVELMIPGIAGLELIQRARQESLCGAVIAVCRFFSNYMTDAIGRLSVDYAVQKPCLIQSLTDRVDDLCAALQSAGARKADEHSVVSSILLALSMATHRKGFRYSRMGVQLLAEDPTRQITKEVYPVIAKEFSTSSTAVEKAIRSAIEDAWKSGNRDLWRQYFPPAPNGQIPKPTNTEFLSRIADAVSMARMRNAR